MDTAGQAGGHAASSPQIQPQKGRKPRDLELPLSPRLLGAPGPERTPGSGTGSGLQAPRPALTLSLLPTHTLTPALLTPSSLPPSVHFRSSLSPPPAARPSSPASFRPVAAPRCTSLPSAWLASRPPRCSRQGPRSHDHHHQHHHPFWGPSIRALSRRNTVQLKDPCSDCGGVGILGKNFSQE